MTIEGGGHTVDAGEATRIFFVGTDQASLQAYSKAVIGQRQQVAIENVTLKGGLAQGGDGGPYGGGGLGAGGAIFVNQTADVTLDGVNFSGNGAVGGLGAETYGFSQRGSGGGGLGGDGGDGSPVSAGAGGGLFGQAGRYGGGGGGVFGNGGDSFGGGGGYSGSAGSPNSLMVVEGMGSGGGGGNGLSGRSGGRGGGFGGGQGKDDFIGGDGGFGGGGSGGSGARGGAGGFGGGGSGSRGGGGGDGGFGAGGGVDTGNASGQSGFGASAPIQGDPNHLNSAGVGGNGAGLGGAVFVAQGGTLKISGTGTETGSSARQGGGDASTGYGAGIFFQGNAGGGAPATLVFGDGDQAYASQITDLSGAPNGGTARNGFGGIGGVMALEKSGTGTLTLSASNTYSGDTTVSVGTLQVDGATAAVSDVNVGAHGTLTGGGTAAGEVTVSGTVTANARGFAGSGASYGTLATGALTMKAGAHAVAEIGDGRHDTIDVTGAVVLDGSLDLAFADGVSARRGTVLTLIANDGTDKVGGTFTNYDEGDVVTANGRGYRLSYHGGDGGNDVTLTALNVAPDAAGLTRSLRLDEDASATVLFTKPASVADLDGDTLTATLTLSDATAGGLAGATATATPGVYTITGSAAEVSAALAAVTFKPAADFNGPLDVDVAISDGNPQGTTGTQPSGTVTITVAAVNDRPEVARAIENQSVAEDTAWHFTIPAGAFSDVDEDALSYTASLADGHPLQRWLTFDEGTRTFSGTPPEDFHGTLSFTVTASDGRLSVSDTFDLEVRSVNDAPSGTSATITGSEDAAITLTAASFGFRDADGNGLSGVRFDTLPAGTLTYSETGEAVVAGTTYDRSNGQSFTFTPATDRNGEAAASLTFRVVDDGGTSDGGADTDTSARTLTFDLSPANDAPMPADDMLRLTQVATATGNVIAGTPGGGTDTGRDGDTLSVLAIAYRGTQAVPDGGQTSIEGRYGTLTIESDGEYRYAAGLQGRLAVGDTGTDTFTYTVDDGHGGTDTAMLTLTVTGTARGTAGDDFFFLTGHATSAAGERGSDAYVVDDASDRPTEARGDGADLDSVLATADYTLVGNADIELLRSLDANSRAGLNLTGNNLGQKVYGDAGDNTIDDKNGADILRGYGGQDTFVFSTKLGADNVDRIQDFSARDDTIGLDAAIFRAAGPKGTLNANVFQDITDGAGLGANDRILYDRDTGVVSYDADGGGSAKAVAFAILAKHPTLTFQDFSVV